MSVHGSRWVAVDPLITNRIWTAMGLDPATTLHDIRWGEQYGDDFFWVFEISGSVPASHNGGYHASHSMRQGSVGFRVWHDRGRLE
jgi:hypothetical protein